ncbi:BlaI/MecI/CopY family transcriptional regulator [Runella sp. SP2]|uniref:BlaI/MecI/CopY family transcriptional regulator n=1 Tax=Runella sp. SP2 TaxID=2268026 RepID=UPI000F078553|nr:BlaI/MecI/CopY family transcriptional regulator [Runella sp. SP2]AYQ35918.1 BlaI/MecI/CopY family transcriptional regulator [Runella sp. SP2]
MQLSKAEEQLMEYLWRQGPIFMKDLIEAHPDPKPAATTVATLLKRMQDKGFVGYETFGNSRQYHALVTKEDYFGKHVKGLIQQFFGNSASQFASFFTTATDLSETELEDLKSVIEQQIKNKQQ